MLTPEVFKFLDVPIGLCVSHLSIQRFFGTPESVTPLSDPSDVRIDNHHVCPPQRVRGTVVTGSHVRHSPFNSFSYLIGDV